MRVGIASILQETNTFSIRPTTIDDFRMATGGEVFDVVLGTNSELAGANEVLQRSEAEVVPLVYAWAMPSGRVTAEDYRDLRDALSAALHGAGPLDAVVLSLHGAMAAEGLDDVDGQLINTARSVVGPSAPIAVCLDLHANVTRAMVEAADSISAYHTDPHVDMSAAGARAAARALEMADSEWRPATGFAKRPMIVPAESMNTDSGIISEIRTQAKARSPEGLLELCIFPVQPWLDVAELGLAVVATLRDNEALATQYAEEIADMIWARRSEFSVDRLLRPEEAIKEASGSQTRPFLIAESADAPTAGATGDSPVMVAALQSSGVRLTAYVPIVDPDAVSACHVAGVGKRVSLQVGASIDTRWWDPVSIEGIVERIGEGSYRLEGASFTGMEVAIGRFAVVGTGTMKLLLTERPAWTSDPATFRFAGLAPELADIIVVRSCSDFRPNYPGSADHAVTLDVPGAATPRLTNLSFTAQERAPYPLDPWPEFDR